MLGIFACLLAVTACQSRAEALRIDAFGRLGKGDITGALDDVRHCAQAEDDEERFHCSSMVGELETIVGDYREAAQAFGEAFAIRDRIAAAKHYGTPDAAALYEWAYADVQTRHLAEASRVIVRAKASATEEGDNHLLVAALLLLEAEIAQRGGDAGKVASLRIEASGYACASEEIKYFDRGDAKHLAGRFMPTRAWLDVGDVCAMTGSDVATVMYMRALDQATVRNEPQLAVLARAKSHVTGASYLVPP